MLMTIRKGGYKPKFVCVYLYPVKRIPCTHEFIDVDLSATDEIAELSEYELDALRDVDVCLVGRQKDDRLRNAVRSLAKLTNKIVVSSDEHDMVNIYTNGKWS